MSNYQLGSQLDQQDDLVVEDQEVEKIDATNVERVDISLEIVVADVAGKINFHNRPFSPLLDVGVNR